MIGRFRTRHILVSNRGHPAQMSNFRPPFHQLFCINNLPNVLHNNMINTFQILPLTDLCEVSDTREDKSIKTLLNTAEIFFRIWIRVNTGFNNLANLSCHQHILFSCLHNCTFSFFAFPAWTNNYKHNYNKTGINLSNLMFAANPQTQVDFEI